MDANLLPACNMLDAGDSSNNSGTLHIHQACTSHKPAALYSATTQACLRIVTSKCRSYHCCVQNVFVGPMTPPRSSKILAVGPLHECELISAACVHSL